MVKRHPTKEGKKIRRGISIKRTAYHEAGHAVMAYILHVRLKEVTIIPDGDTLGMCTHDAGQSIKWEDARRTRNELERRTMVSLAGNVAEHLLTGGRHIAGSGNDYHEAVNLLLSISGPDETSKYAEWLWYRTKGVLSVDYWWLAIQRLAEELLLHKHLKSKRIREIVRLAIDEDLERKVQRRKSRK